MCRGDGAAAEEHAFDVYRHHLVKVRLGEIDGFPPTRNPGIVDEDIDPSPCRKHFVHHLVHLDLTRDVALDGQRAPADFLDPLCHFFAFVHPVPDRDDDVGAKVRQSQRQPRAPILDLLR